MCSIFHIACFTPSTCCEFPDPVLWLVTSKIIDCFYQWYLSVDSGWLWIVWKLIDFSKCCYQRGSIYWPVLLCLCMGKTVSRMPPTSASAPHPNTQLTWHPWQSKMDSLSEFTFNTLKLKSTLMIWQVMLHSLHTLTSLTLCWHVTALSPRPPSHALFCLTWHHAVIFDLWHSIKCSLLLWITRESVWSIRVNRQTLTGTY